MQYDRFSLVFGEILLGSLQSKSMIGKWDGMVASIFFWWDIQEDTNLLISNRDKL